jgi:pilus assembly protein CpaF
MRAFGRRQNGGASTSSETEVEAFVPNGGPAATAPAAVPQAMEAEGGPIQRLRNLVMERVDPVIAAELPPGALRAQLEELVNELANRERIEISGREQSRIAEELAHDMVGYGPLEPLLNDDSVNDIMVNGPDNIFIEIRGKVIRSNVRFRNAQQIAAIAQKMAATVGRRVDESSPLVDCRLLDGSRVNVVFPPLALDGPYISIRKFMKRKFDLQAMVSNGTMSAPVARVLEIAARCRLNVVISGGTGSGKTTMLNAMSRLIDHGERIVTIEDAAELQLQQPHVVRMETRPMNLEGRGEITQRDLVKNALRMRPDRVILGEVRGAEAFDMLQAMNTGHDGSFCTVHANTTRDALVRVENMVQMGQFSLPMRAIRTQIASAVDVIVQIERMRDGGRRLSQLSEVCGLEGDVITMNDIFNFEYSHEDSHGRIQGRWVSPGVRPAFYERLNYFGLGETWMRAVGEAL